MGSHLPRRVTAASEHLDLGVLGREEVIVAWLAAYAASAVGQVDCREVRVDDWVGLGGAVAAVQAGSREGEAAPGERVVVRLGRSRVGGGEMSYMVMKIYD